MPFDALALLRKRLALAAEAGGLSFDPSRLTAGRRTHVSLFCGNEGSAAALCRCFVRKKALQSAAAQDALLRGDVSEAFLKECLVLLCERELPPFAFPEEVSEEALFSFPLYQAARLWGLSPACAPAVPPEGPGRDLFWALLTLSAFPDPKKRAKPLLMEAERFLSRLPPSGRGAHSGLFLAARLALFEQFSV